MPAISSTLSLLLKHQLKLVVVFFEGIFLGKDFLEAVGRAAYASVDKGSTTIKSGSHQNRVVITLFNLF